MDRNYSTLEMFRIFKALVVNQKQKRINLLSSDKDGEYFPMEFNNFCEENGIIHERSASYALKKMD